MAEKMRFKVFLADGRALTVYKPASSFYYYYNDEGERCQVRSNMKFVDEDFNAYTMERKGPGARAKFVRDSKATGGRGRGGRGAGGAGGAGSSDSRNTGYKMLLADGRALATSHLPAASLPFKTLPLTVTIAPVDVELAPR